jgi:hypothetical protein
VKSKPMKKPHLSVIPFLTVISAAGAIPISVFTLAGLPLPAQAQEGTVSQITGAAIPKGASRVPRGSLTAGMGRLMTGGAREFKLPEPEKSGDAEVYFWTGSNYKEGRARFLYTQFESALTEAGYTVTQVDDSYQNTPNVFDEDKYGTAGLSHSSGDPRPVFFHANNVEKKQTIVGVWLDQQSKSRLVLAVGEVGFAGAPKVSKAPTISDPDVWVVKDFKNAGKGMPAPPMPAFSKMAPKPRTVRGMVKDGSGKPIAGARLVAWASAAGGFRTSVEGRTNAQGIYEMPLPIGICQIVNADCRVTYSGNEMLLPLHPVDGERDEFDSRQGHVENFVLRTSGSANETGGTGGSYGAPMRILTWNTIEKSIIEVTLKPKGPLADGSPAKTLVFRWKAPAAGLSSETIIGGIPLGQYKLTAKLYDGDDALPLRAKKTFSDGGENPFAPSLDVEFESENNGGRASLGRSGIKRFEVTLEP